MDKRKLIVNNSIATVNDESAKKMLISEEGIAGEPFFSFAEENEALYGYKGNGEVIKFITDKEIDSKYVKKTEVAQSDWNEADTTNPAYIKNKPELGTSSPKDVPVSGNASDDQVVLGNDTRLLPQDASDVVYDGEHISDFKGTNLKESVIELENAIIDNEQATAAALNDLNKRINDIPDATVTGITVGDKVLTLDGTNLTSTINLAIDETTDASGKRYIKLLGIDNADLGKIDISEFIKDGMLESAELVEDPEGQEKGTYIKLSWNDASGKTPMFLNVTSLIDIYVQGYGIKISGKQISVDTDVIATKDYVDNTKYTGTVNIDQTTGETKGTVIIENNAGGKAFKFSFSGIKGKDGVIGNDGKSAYEIAQDEGFTGSTDEWLTSLKGAKGDKGDKGDTGAQGPKGDDGKAVTIRATKEDCKIVDTDAYLEIDENGTYNVWILREGGTFENVGPFAIKGDKGDKGDTGPQGSKGDQGEKGDTGAAAGIANKHNASIDNNVGTPSVVITASGENTNKVFTFDFKNLKGATGEKGEKGDTGTAATITASVTKTETGESGTKANVKITEQSGSTPSNKVLNFEFTIPRGDKGADGKAVTIRSSKSQCTIIDTDAYIEESTDGNYYVYILREGSGDTGTYENVGPFAIKGDTGPQGPQGEAGPQGKPGSNGSDGAPGEDGHSPYVSGGTWYQWSETQNKYISTGISAQGETGPAGASIDHIKDSESNGVHTITAYLDSDETEDVGSFTVSDGKDGHSPSISINDEGNWVIDGYPYGSSRGDSATVSVGDVTTSTGNAGTDATVSIREGNGNTSTDGVWDFHFTIPRGENGSTPEYKDGDWYIGTEYLGTAVGADGEGITGITTSAIAGGTNITFNGNKGSSFGPVSVKDGHSPTITINSDGNWVIDGTPSGSSKGDSAEITGATATANTLDYGANASADVDVTGTSLQRGFKFTFGIPKGKDGTTLSDSTINTINTLVNYSISSGGGDVLCGGSSLSEIKSCGASFTKEGNLSCGAITSSGDVNASAFYETSDENLKWFTGEIPVDFEQLKSIPKQYFIWRNREAPTNIGTSAQKVQKVYPEIVSEANDGHLTVDYGKLSIVALKAIDILNERIEKLEAEIKELKSKS